MSESKDVTMVLNSPPKCPDCCIKMDLKSKPTPGAESVRFVCPSCQREQVVVLTEETAVDE